MKERKNKKSAEVKNKGLLRRFFGYYKPYKTTFFLDMLCSLIFSASGLFYPMITTRVLRESIPNSAWTEVFTGLAQYRQEDIIDDEGNLVAQARRRPEREVDLDFSKDEDDGDEGEDGEGDDLFADAEFGALEMDPVSEPQTQEV